MVTFNLHGELGNQMFEWAAGIAFSRLHNTNLEFQTLPGVAARMSEFTTAQHYSIRESLVKNDQLSLFARAARRAKLKIPFDRSQMEKGLNFQHLKFVEGSTYHGYFQSWRYFHHLRDLLISEFSLVAPSESFGELSASLDGGFTAIHIRRGGSGAAILTSDYHGLLDVEYYNRAISLSEELGGSKKYVVFTDNPEKALETVQKLCIENVRIIGPQDTHSQTENLLLMTKATSFIGANSSYSWWAAYLNLNLLTKPIFPRQWYMDPDLSNNDMLLPDWISIGFSQFLNEEAPRGIHLEQ